MHLLESLGYIFFEDWVKASSDNKWLDRVWSPGINNFDVMFELFIFFVLHGQDV